MTLHILDEKKRIIALLRVSKWPCKNKVDSLNKNEDEYSKSINTKIRFKLTY